jgi:hypothetical protein
MNAHVRPPYRPPAPIPELKLILDAGRAANLAFSLGACRTAEEADRHADNMEVFARQRGAAATQLSNAVDQLQSLELAGDYARRARLYRDRAKELRS